MKHRLRRRAPEPAPRPQRPLPAGVTTSELTRLELRRQCVLAGRPAESTILEIGPAHNAILPKREGYAAKTVDYLDREGLVRKYEAHDSYDPADIEEVDYVLAPGARMAEAIPERFDVVVASHVIEHTTSMVDFVNESAKLLNPGGHLALVVPDYRFCFDRFRERSSLGRIIDAHLDPRSVHSVGSTIDYTLNAVRHRGKTAWKPGHKGEYSFVNGIEEVSAHRAKAELQDEYVDIHHWVFSPNHLRLLMHDLATLGYVELRESFFHPTVRHDFFLNLSLEGEGSGLTREELVSRSNAELRTLDAPRWSSR